MAHDFTLASMGRVRIWTRAESGKGFKVPNSLVAPLLGERIIALASLHWNRLELAQRGEPEHGWFKAVSPKPPGITPGKSASRRESDEPNRRANRESILRGG